MKPYRKFWAPALFIVLLFAVYIRTLSVVPGKIILFEGEEYRYDFKSPFIVSIKADRNGIIKLNNSEIAANGTYFRLSNPVSFKSEKNGCVNLSIRLFGLIPFKTLQVDVMPNKKLVACGSTIGVKLKLNGLLVIGISDVETAEGKKIIPSKGSGLRTGDMLIEANNIKLSDIDALVAQIDKCGGRNLDLKCKRGGLIYNISIKPVLSIDDGRYHIGLWVRDSTAGIGTLTFYDPETGYFGALGHGITDIDTGTLMTVDSGDILQSNILAVKKGRQGSPGELKGVFIEDKNKLGIVKYNSEAGIYGTINTNALALMPERLYPVAQRTQIREGEATILANIEGRSIEEFSVYIKKVSKQNSDGSKGMIVRITDKKLLENTGGIVQGMSGSPIIQDGKIIGAVTHVLVNDPTRGYGIYIESMLRNIPGNNFIKLKNAS